MKRYIFLVALLQVLVHGVYAQLNPGLTPPSPTAASLTKVVDMPVNLYTGAPDISIPLYTVKERTLSTSITLKYIGANGIKVQDIAGPAGLGWSLLAGGVVTRTVRGFPDEMPGRGYCMNNLTGLSADTSTSTFKNTLSNSIDSADFEPDVFSCTIGGRIIFSGNKTPRFINQHGCVIKKNGLFQSDSTWEIIDTKGNKYIFGKNPEEREHSKTFIASGSGLNPKFISSWYLSEIKSVEGQVIRFTYEKGIASDCIYYTNTRDAVFNIDLGYVVKDDTTDHSTTTHIYETVYLKSIITSNTQVTFSYNDRWDILGQRSIEKITISDRSGNKNTAFRFYNGYFSDGPNPYARPKLLSVEQLDSSQNKFIKIADFHYNETQALPARSSSKFDHWGYYNNNTSQSRFKSRGANKNTDTAKCKAAILTAIDWPTGGRTEYVYESNVFHRNSTTYFGGGVRIAKIRQIDSNTIKETTYSYLNSDNTSSGLLQSSFNPDSGYVSTSNLSFYYTYPGGSSSFTGRSITEYDIPLYQLVDFNGVSVGYSRVAVTYPDQSKEVYSFQDYNSFPDIPEGIFYASYGYFFNVTNYYSPHIHGLFNLYTPYHQQRGLIKEKQLLNNSGDIVQKNVYTYASATMPSITAPEVVQKKVWAITGDGYNEQLHWITCLYRERAGTSQLISEEIILYNDGNATDTNKQFTRNYYQTNYPFILNKQVKSLSNGDSSIVTYKYPMDIVGTGSDIGSYMTELNIIPPVETVTKYKSGGSESVTNAVLSLYSGNSTKVSPSSVRQLEIAQPITDYQSIGVSMTNDSRSKPKLIYDLYASSGELLQYHEADNTPVAIFWGYKHAFPVAKVVGATYAAAVLYVDTALLNAATVSESAMRTELAKLRQNLPLASVTTCTYSPLIGTSSETDPSGKTVYYEYDDFSRLKVIKDHDGNIIKKQEYYFASLGRWQDTNTKRCLRDSNDRYTGEEEVQQIDTDPTSSTYNQTRWRSLGWTYNCNKPIYAKIFLENPAWTSHMDPYGGSMYDAKEATLVVRFYEDSLCTIPMYVRPIDVSYYFSLSSGGIPRTPVPESGTVQCTGASFVLKENAVIEEEQWDTSYPTFHNTYSYTLLPGSEYIIRN